MGRIFLSLGKVSTTWAALGYSNPNALGNPARDGATEESVMNTKPINSKYKLKLDKAYGTIGGNRFQRVVVVEKSTGETKAAIDVKTRNGTYGSLETRAKIIKDFALIGLRNNQSSIDATEE